MSNVIPSTETSSPGGVSTMTTSQAATVTPGAALTGPHLRGSARESLGVATAGTQRIDRRITPAAGHDIMSAVGLRKSYRKGQVSIPVLSGVDMQVRSGEFLSIVGKSGSGKSTLMHLLATLDAPDAGEIRIGSQRIDNLGAVKRDRIRNHTLGIVFQFYHLLPELTTWENVTLPSIIDCPVWSFWSRRRAIKERARQLLDQVGLSHRLKHKPRELSGGEMQRGAIARALVGKPEILLADEPTGNLDSSTGGEIMELLNSLNRDQGITVLMVTHEPDMAEYAKRVIHFRDGQVEQDERLRELAS